MTFDDILKDINSKLDELRPKNEVPYISVSRVIYSLASTKNSTDRLFKKSKHRSKRLHKKLLRKFNGFQFRQEPAIYQNGSQVIAHPAFMRDIERQLNANIESSIAFLPKKTLSTGAKVKL